MDNKDSLKIYLLSFFLILFILFTLILSYIIYRLYNEKTDNKYMIASLQNKITNFSNINNDNSNNTNSVNIDSTTNSLAESNQENITKSEAEKIAKDTYEKTYNFFHDESLGVMTAGEYNINGEEKFGYKVDISKLESVFSKKVIYEIKSQLLEVNGEYYDLSTAPSFYEKLDLSTIFGSTDQSIRPLIVKNYTNNLIIAEGQLTSESEDDIIFGHFDEYPLYIIFVRDGDNWLIDLYE